MYAASIAAVATLSLVINPTLLSIFISLHLIVHLKSCWNTLNFLNSDYLTMFIVKTNKLDLNCIIIIVYVLYLMSLVSYKKLPIHLVNFSLLVIYFVTNLNDIYQPFNLNEFYAVVQDLSLSNGAVTIHPVMVLVAYSLVISLIVSIINIDFFNKGLFNCNRIPKATASVKLKSFSYSKILTISISLGAYWAHQELNWGGYWSWDIVEVVSLSILSILLASSHTFRINPPIRTVFLLTVLISLLLLIVRLNIVQSVHGFLSSQLTTINMQYTYLYVLTIVPLVLTLFNGNNARVLRTYVRSYLLQVLLVISIIVIIYPLIVSIMSVIYSDSGSIKHGPFILLISLPIFLYLIDSTSLLNLFLPIHESLVMIKYVTNRKLVFFLRLYHLILIFSFYYFMSLSHIYVLPTFSLDLVADVNPVIKASTNYLLLSNLISDFSTKYSLSNYLTINDYAIHYYLTKHSKGLFSGLLVTSSTTTGIVDKSLILELMLQKLGWTLPIIILLSALILLSVGFSLKRRIIFYY